MVDVVVSRPPNEPKAKLQLPVLPVASEPDINQNNRSENSHKDISLVSASDTIPGKKMSINTGITIMAVAVFLLGSGISLHGWFTNRAAQAQVSVLAEQAANDNAPDETEVSDDAIASYAVAPDLPRLISIDEINVLARIKRVGVTSASEIQTPQNTNDTGWYDASAKPGEAGAMLIVGHVSGLTRAGIFYNLNKLTKGSSITIERGDGQKFTYRVVKTETVPKDEVDMAKALVPIEPGKNGLNLITCIGDYISADSTFSDRFIVYAVEE